MAFRIFDAAAYHASAAPGRIAIEGDTGTWTYGELRETARRLASGLAARGIGPGGRIAVLAKNRAETLALLHAAAMIEAVLVPLNHRLSASELDWIVRDSKAAVVFFEEEFTSKLGGWATSPIEGLSPRADGGGWLGAADALQPSGDGSGPYLQIYTSGTTGHPKGVVLTEANAAAQQLAVSASLGVRIAAGDRLYQNLPLFHIGGVFVSLHGLFNGASLILRRDFQPQEALRILSGPGPLHAVMVPTMIQACTQAPLADDHRFDGLRSLLFGASPISPDLLRQAASRFRCDLAQIYGMTETHSVISVLNPDAYRAALSGENPALLSSAGRAVAGTELRIVGPDGTVLPPGGTGEIIVRAGQVMAGYWARPEDTAATVREGFLRTGDAGRLDDDGYLYIVDRLKDIIVSGGENIASLDVENALAGHPMVADVAVIGVPHPLWGETVKAIVVARPDTRPDAEELIRFCRERLAGFKVPRSVDFIDALPRNGTGKVLKRQLREAYWQGESRRVG